MIGFCILDVCTEDRVIRILAIFATRSLSFSPRQILTTSQTFVPNRNRVGSGLGRDGRRALLASRVPMFATHSAWGLTPRVALIAPRARGGRRSAGHGASRSRLERYGSASLESRRAAVTASASRPSGSTPVPSGDGNIVPDAFQYASHRPSRKHGKSLGAAQAAAGAAEPSADPSQSVDPKERHPRGVPGHARRVQRGGGADGVPELRAVPLRAVRERVLSLIHI